MVTPDLLEPMRLAVEAALDKKGFQIVVLDVSELTSYTDGFVLCSADFATAVLRAQLADPLSLICQSGRRSVNLSDQYSCRIQRVATRLILLDRPDHRSVHHFQRCWNDSCRNDIRDNLRTC